MFRKSLVLLFPALILVGCGEKSEVNVDMLLGEWSCQTEGKIAEYNKNGKLGEFIALKPEPAKILFTEDSNMKGDDENIIVIHDDFNVKTDITNTYNGFEMNIKNEYVYISQDQFKSIVDIDYENNYVTHVEGLCKRIVD